MMFDYQGAETTRIRALTIKAPEALHSKIERDVSTADWPSTDDERIIFIRKITATGSADEIAHSLREETLRQIREQPGDNVRIFPNTHQMLAQLLMDAAKGELGHHWYWRKWNETVLRSAHSPVMSILSEHIPTISSALTFLAKQNKAAVIMEALSEREAGDLLIQLSSHSGYSLNTDYLNSLTAMGRGSHVIRNTPEEDNPRPHEESNDPASASENRISDAGSDDFTFDKDPLNQIPEHHFRIWQTALANTVSRAHLALVAFLIAQEHLPLPLHNRTEEVLSVVAEKLNRSVFDTGISVERPENQEYTNKSYQPQSDFSGEHENKYRQPVVDSEKSTMTTDHGSDKSADKDTTIADESISLHISSESESSGRESLIRQAVRSVKDDTEVTPVSDLLNSFNKDQDADRSFGSQFGGILYLLNFLNRQPVQAIIRKHWRSVPGVWTWLSGAVETFDNNSVLKNDPLYDYIIHRTHPARTKAGTHPINTTCLSPELICELRQVSETLYPRHLWNTELLSLSSDIGISQDRIVVRADLSEANINARLHGLDINPGWLPWLGYTVQFQFEHGFRPTPVKRGQHE
ncbi:MAG: hypothetical protein C9355_04555 [Thalassolituus maritimus]|nr:MAG: hypothetical protein C9355_04555 [Thalassolituus maritimus]